MKIYVIFVVALLKAPKATTNEINNSAAADEVSLLVKTNSGVVLGRHIKSYDGRIVSAFEGIPYAQPPLGQLRFQLPQPVNKWNNILIANNTYTCIHRMHSGQIIGTEDCLYLYIYVPRKTIIKAENLDVVVGIHSGCFMRGDPHNLCGPGYLMDRDLIYVSLNYRLSMLGFLSTEDDVVPGNNGLKDQVLAFQWIKDNIKYFGGNPNSVTLLGVSAGGSSTQFHYLSPMSRDLFTRGISLSGAALNSWVLTKNPAKKAKMLAQLVNCPPGPSKLLVECLQTVDAESLTAASAKFNAISSVNIPITPFGPVIERGKNAFLPDHPYKLLLEGRIKIAPWISSTTINEGLFPVGAILAGDGLTALDKYWNNALPIMLDCSETVEEKDKRQFADRLRNFYMNNETLSMDNIYRLVNLFGDRIFKLDVEKATRIHAKMSKSQTYCYLFTYLLDMRAGFQETLNGVAHMDDARLIHPVLKNSDILSENDEKLKNMFIDLVSNFASGKTPTFGNTKWKALERNLEGREMNCLHINGPDSIYMKTIKEIAPTDFWKSLPIKENEVLYKGEEEGRLH